MLNNTQESKIQNQNSNTRYWVMYVFYVYEERAFSILSICSYKDEIQALLLFIEKVLNTDLADLRACVVYKLWDDFVKLNFPKTITVCTMCFQMTLYSLATQQKFSYNLAVPRCRSMIEENSWNVKSRSIHWLY